MLDRVTPAKASIQRLLSAAESAKMVRLDAVRKQRNLTEYTGDLIPESAVASRNDVLDRTIDSP